MSDKRHVVLKHMAALACMAGLSAAQAEPFAAWGASSLSGLDIQLTDLNPNDGVTPWISFTDPSGVGAYVYADGDQSLALNPELAMTVMASGKDGEFGAVGYALTQSPAHVISLDGLSQGALTETSLSTSSRLLASDLRDRSAPYSDVAGSQEGVNKDWMLNAGGYGGVGSGGASLVSYEFGPDYMLTGFRFNPEGASNWPYFTVSANTAVTFRGQLDAHAAVDPAQTGVFDPALTNLSASGFASVSVSHLETLDGQTYWTDEQAMLDAFQTQSALVDVSVDTSRGDGVLADTQSQAFSLSFVNARGSDTKGLLEIQVNHGVGANGMAVPEPSTYAMMGLGLIGLAWARRRSAMAQI
jgi:hypothetical protein